MTPIQQAMLARFGSFSRAAIFFTTSVNGYQPMAPVVAQRNLEELEALCMVVKVKGGGYKLTHKGQAQVDWPGKTAPQPARRADWIPPKWEPARGGADQHLQHQSLGNKPQIERVGQ